jgi:hypothetical protein
VAHYTWANIRCEFRFVPTEKDLRAFICSEISFR